MSASRIMKFALLLMLAMPLLGCAPEEAKHKAAGNVLFKRKDFVGAEREYRKAVAAKPRDAGAHVLLAEALFNQQRLGDARAEFEQALELKPKSPDAHKGLAEVLLGQAPVGDAAAVDAALPHLDAVLAERPGDLVTLVYSAKLVAMKAARLSDATAKLAAFDDAVARLERARRVRAAELAVHYELAIMLAKRAAALRAAQAPADWQARASADDSAATAALAELERRAPGSYVVPYGRAVTAMVAGKADEALAALGEALARPDAQAEVALTDSHFEGLRGDPRFQALVKKP